MEMLRVERFLAYGIFFRFLWKRKNKKNLTQWNVKIVALKFSENVPGWVVDIVAYGKNNNLPTVLTDKTSSNTSLFLFIFIVEHALAVTDVHFYFTKSACTHGVLKYRISRYENKQNGTPEMM